MFTSLAAAAVVVPCLSTVVSSYGKPTAFRCPTLRPSDASFLALELNCIAAKLRVLHLLEPTARGVASIHLFAFRHFRKHKRIKGLLRAGGPSIPRLQTTGPWPVRRAGVHTHTQLNLCKRWAASLLPPPAGMSSHISWGPAQAGRPANSSSKYCSVCRFREPT